MSTVQTRRNSACNAWLETGSVPHFRSSGGIPSDVDVDVERFAGAGLSLFARLLTNVITIYFT